MVFEKNNKIDKSVARLRNKERTQIIKLRNEREQITTDATEIKWIIKEQLYTKKLDNLEEMDKFLERYDLLKLNHEEIEHLNRPTTSKEIEVVIKTSSQRKAQDQMALWVFSAKHLKNK